ncbi:MAG: hypothetical protein M1813_002183 [Trichoglossum hirsutum]|nr:MAG: hypothetical protein M1813_002183 [Trichoglossum hirsutum]
MVSYRAELLDIGFSGPAGLTEQEDEDLFLTVDPTERRLLGPRGKLINFAENGSIAFRALLNAGYFHDLCGDIHKKPKAVLRQSMSPCRTYLNVVCWQSYTEFAAEIVKRSSPSIVFLLVLPKYGG